MKNKDLSAVATITCIKCLSFYPALDTLQNNHCKGIQTKNQRLLLLTFLSDFLFLCVHVILIELSVHTLFIISQLSMEKHVSCLNTSGQKNNIRFLRTRLYTIFCDQKKTLRLHRTEVEKTPQSTCY